jgi:general secretion pathway protein E
MPAATSNAAEVVGDVGQEVDLTRMMQELPAVEDLLEAAGRRADHPHDQRAAHPGVRQTAPATSTSSPTSAARWCASAVDGVLREVAQPHKALHAAMASRIKIMAELDIAEKRLPQDGRIALRWAAGQVDVRVSTLPTTHGERAVLRLLDKGSRPVQPRQPGHGAATRVRPFAELLQSRTASCWSPAPPARARPPPCTPASAGHGHRSTATS